MAHADTILAAISDKQAQAAELRKKLEGSLKIKALWPEAFDHGSAKVGGRAKAHEPHKGTITIRNGVGEVREFPAMDVPFELWPAGMRADYYNLRADIRRRIEGRLK